MTNIADRKTRLIIETPSEIQGRPIVLQAEPWGLNVRLKGLRTPYKITWAQVYNRAAILEVEAARAAKKAAKKARQNNGQA